MLHPDVADFNPLDEDTLQCPHAAHALLRQEDPVHYVASLDLYFVARHDLVMEALRNPDVFSSTFPETVLPITTDDQAQIAAAQAEGIRRVPAMVTLDGSTHARYRRLVAKAFSPRSIKALEPHVRSITNRLIDTWIDRDQIEFVEEFAIPLPVEVIAKALNVPEDRQADFRRWSDATVASFGSNLPVAKRVEGIRTVNELQRFFVDQVEMRRRDPQDDFLTSLIDARIDDDSELEVSRPLDVAEIVSVVHQLLVGGNETTTKLLAGMVRLLAEHPDEWARIRRDPALIPGAVDEALRLTAPAQAMWRTTKSATVLGGVEIPAASRVVLSFSSSNRDEQVFDRPDVFDSSRENVSDHLAFGKGIHFCIGASLARLEARVAFEELVRRLDSFSLSASNEFRYNPSFLLQGLVSLDVDIVAARP